MSYLVFNASGADLTDVNAGGDDIADGSSASVALTSTELEALLATDGVAVTSATSDTDHITAATRLMERNVGASNTFYVVNASGATISDVNTGGDDVPDGDVTNVALLAYETFDLVGAEGVAILSQLSSGGELVRIAALLRAEFLGAPDGTLRDIMDALGSALGGLPNANQIVARLNLTPDEPCIDIYPAFTSLEEVDERGFGPHAMGAYLFTVRARVGVVDHEGGQDILLDWMDRESDVGVAALLEADQTLSGRATSVDVGPVSGFIRYLDANGQIARLGAEWPVRVIPAP